MLELFRYSENAWGQRTLAGMSWDLIGVFAGIAVAAIVIHALYSWLLAPKKQESRQ
jgi:hypothetical protein